MSTNPYTSPLTPGESPPPRTGQSQSRLITWLVVGGILLTLAALLIPFRRGGARPAARRMSCINNLHNIALALRSYEAVYGAFPPAYTVDSAGQPLHSWRTLILPYLEQKALYDTIDLSKPWDDPINKTALETPLKIYLCPESVGPPTHTTYLALVASNSCLQPGKPRRLRDVTDSHQFTLKVSNDRVKSKTFADPLARAAKTTNIAAQSFDFPVC